ncbi:hypothetical protein K458DRAFT_378535 [Lentithecium fluviatile CBS 122367]|uniref:Uncharacterized protein n=1 Tax=Lentithecium fluviatile CBS 122367 TaxID=1168545 RepID=A0A6G1IGU7_9PLEO|nr:hypothetical protein K458DRAFT_378535 [Lentithecium fluviatile CBS 122367]
MNSSISSMSDHGYPAIHDDSTKLDMTHLSGMTMAEFIKEPHINLIHPSPSVSQRSSMMNSKRASVATASTSKSQLRQTNQVLIHMLSNIQTELAAHRKIMLDIQQRVSHLEYESNASVTAETPRAALQALEGNKDASRRSSKLVPSEGRTWWEACQNYARNSESPISAREFLRTPVRYSGFDFQFGVPFQTNTPPATPPDVDDLPPLTPTSEDGDCSGSDSDLGTPTRHNVSLGEDMLASTPKMETATDIETDIREQTVEIAKSKMPAPPVLQPPPSGKPVSVKEEDVVAAIEPEFDGHPHRFYKGVKSLATYKALMRHKDTNKEHHVLIHFHRRADLKHLED